jgi:putative lipase involved disintegration of autophagic bodies
MTNPTPAAAKPLYRSRTMLFAACLLLLACYHAYGHWQLKRTGMVTLGEIIAVYGKKGEFPTVRFAAPGGRIIILNDLAGMSPRPRIGDQVEVIFHPDRPDDAYVVKTQWTGVFLLVFFACMIAFMRAAVRYKKPNSRPRRHGAGASR